MNRKSKHYIGSFANTPEGLIHYKNVIKAFRIAFKGGRFVKMFRGGSRNHWSYINYKGKNRIVRSGSLTADKGKYFDAYFHRRDGTAHSLRYHAVTSV